jgi:glycerol kinase
MGLLGLGCHASVAALSALRADARVYRRTMHADEVQSRYAGWQRAVQQVLCAA